MPKIQIKMGRIFKLICLGHLIVLLDCCSIEQEPVEIRLSNKYEPLRLEMNSLLCTNLACKSIAYRIDTSIFNLGYEIEFLKEFAGKFGKYGDSSLIGLEYHLVDIPYNWQSTETELDLSNETCIVAYCAIMESSDSNVLFLVAYSYELKKFFKLMIRKKTEADDNWEVIMKSESIENVTQTKN